MSTEDRNAQALERAAAYRSRLAEGTAKPLEEFLAQHEDLRDLLELLFDEAQAVTESIAAAQEAGIATMLPDALQQKILAIHAGSTEERADKMAALCELHPEHAADIRALLSVLEGTEKRVQASAQATSRVPDQIGPYKILSALGEGGMGTVYLARQTEPVQRKVALKLIKLGMDSQQVLRRFEAERQALAMMEHSSIAKVYDAGTTDRGQPFFVMEHIEGQPFTQYCDEQQLNVEERLDLFCQVCAGVQHAHQKGVIHRDLKPSNVLVTVEDGEPTPKIIDFGIARATEQRLVEATFFTEQGQIIGTPEYMSPEQAGLKQQDIDTRSDVYSLGVFVYELLVGSRPFSSKELREAGLSEMERKIREDDPVKPSTRLSSATGDSEQIASQRRTDLKSLTRRLKGDLDWIVMKAMEKDRARRYQTAIELAQDIQRHLSHQPVLASPPSLKYRTAKFVRRYRSQVIAASVLFLALLAGMVGTTTSMFDAQASEQTAQLLATGAPLIKARADLEELYRHPPWPDQIESMQAWIDLVNPLLDKRDEMDRKLQDLPAVAVGNQDDPDAADSEAEVRSRRDSLATLKADLEALERDLVGIQDRLDWANNVDALTVDHPNAPYSWKEARDAIQKADDEVASYLYEYTGEPIDLQPQRGLVPLGPDPDPNNLLWEFYHLGSAADPNVIPKRNAEGRFDITEETGMIFVLIPGGNVQLSSYFVSKYEMTQAQWERLSRDRKNPSFYPGGYEHQPTQERVTGTHPVENVTWEECFALLTQHGLRLPTEVEWEYACRANTSLDLSWFTGRDRKELAKYANVLDKTGIGAELLSSNPPGEDFDDGFGIHSPVGSLEPNPWGLHDVYGNVFEFCQDLVNPPFRVAKGGYFGGGLGEGTGGFSSWHPQVANQNFGVRAVRSLRRDLSTMGTRAKTKASTPNNSPGRRA